MTENNTEVKEKNITPGQESSTDIKKEQADGSQPDIKAQLDKLQKEVDTFSKESEHSKEVTRNMQNALKVEREKRKMLQDKLDGKTATAEFDPEDMANFKKAAKAAGIVTKDDLESIQIKRSQDEATQKNTDIFQTFINKNKTIFGTNDEATTDQEKNLKIFSGYLNEYFDINTKTLANTKNLDKKLQKALEDLKGTAAAKIAEARGVDKANAQNKNSILLSIGAEGGSGSDSKDETWGYNTPKAEAAQHLKAMGYKPEEIKEMIERPKK